MKSTAPEGKMGPIRLTCREADSYTEVTFRRLGRRELGSARRSARWFTRKGMGEHEGVRQEGQSEPGPLVRRDERALEVPPHD